MKAEIAIVKVENGYVVRINKFRYVAKSIREIAGIISEKFAEELEDMEKDDNNHFEFNIAGHGIHSS